VDRRHQVERRRSGLELSSRSSRSTRTRRCWKPGVTGLGHDEATGRYAAGDVAFMPTGVWQAPEPGVVRLPSSTGPTSHSREATIAEDNQYLFGKYDLSFMIAADTPYPGPVEGVPGGARPIPSHLSGVRQRSGIPAHAAHGDARQQARGGCCSAAQQLPSRLRAVLGRPDRCVGQWADASQAASWFAAVQRVEPMPPSLADQAQADLEAGLERLTEITCVGSAHPGTGSRSGNAPPMSQNGEEEESPWPIMQQELSVR
jgi:hypothetical protein